MLTWKLVHISKEKEPVVAPNKSTNKPVIPSMFFNPFKYKQGNCYEPKNVDEHTKKKDKGQRQPLALHQQQLCKYH